MDAIARFFAALRMTRERAMTTSRIERSTVLKTVFRSQSDHTMISLLLRIRSAPMIWRNFCRSSSIERLMMV